MQKNQFTKMMQRKKKSEDRDSVRKRVINALAEERKRKEGNGDR